MKLPNPLVWSFAIATMCAACGGDSGSTSVTQGDDDDDVSADTDNVGTPPAPWNTVEFTTTTVETSSPGLPRGDLGTLARATDGTLYYTYLAQQESANDACQDLAITSGTNEVPGVHYDVQVAVQAAGTSGFGTPQRIPVENATSESAEFTAGDFVGARLGLDAAVAPNGHLLVATPGGQNGQFTCNAANLLLADRTPGSGAFSISAVTIDSGDYAGSSTCTDLEHDSDLSCCPADQDACGTGTDSGYYPSIAFDSDDAYHIAYLDAHYVTDNDGKTHGDFELLNEGGGFEGINMWSGYGYFSTLRYVGTTGLVVTVGGLTGGLKLFRKKQGEASWTIVDFGEQGSVSGRPRMEIAPDGTIGIAYYQTSDVHGTATNDLWLCEYAPTDTELLTPLCDRPESPALVAGQDASLAYDNNSLPVLAYYYCGGGTCVHDGLRVAWRDQNGEWWRFNAHNVDNDRSGNSASIVVDPTTGEPTIVFQDLTTGAAMVAYGKFN